MTREVDARERAERHHAVGAGTSAATLVIFACEGREHLIGRTLQSLDEKLQYPFKSRILVTDGVLDPAVVARARVDVVFERTRRMGYVRNIVTALRLVE